MFSRLFRSTTSLFFGPSPGANSHPRDEADTAALSGERDTTKPVSPKVYQMVQTRRQSQVNPEHVSQRQSARESDGQEAQRPSSPQDTSTPLGRKRRKIERPGLIGNTSVADLTEPEGDAAGNIHEDLPVRPKDDDHARMDVPPTFSAAALPEVERGLREAAANQTQTKPSMVPMLSRGSRKTQRKLELLDGTHTVDPKDLARGSQSPPHKKPKRSKKATDKTNPTPEPSHVRFDGKEPQAEAAPIQEHPGLQNGSNQSPPPANETAEEDSDDEAPEAESLSTGQAKAKALALGASKAVETQDRAAREKRQAREKRLKSQASTNKKKRELEDERQRAHQDRASRSPSASRRSPARINVASVPSSVLTLLPDDILAVEPIERPSTPPPESNLAKAQFQKRRFLIPEEKKPRDVQRHGVKLRTLEDRTDQHLPPKVVKRSRALREQWLLGRRSEKVRGEREGGMERRKPTGGFLRR